MPISSKVRESLKALKKVLAGEKSPEYYAKRAVALRSQGFSWPVIWQRLNIPDYQGEQKEKFYQLIEEEKKKQGCILQ